MLLNIFSNPKNPLELDTSYPTSNQHFSLNLVSMASINQRPTQDHLYLTPFIRQSTAGIH